MALINCPECRKQVSDQSTSCPSCGYPIKQNTVSPVPSPFPPPLPQSFPPPLPDNGMESNNDGKNIPFTLIFLGICLILIIYYFSGDNTDSVSQSSNKNYSVSQSGNQEDSSEHKITSSKVVGGDADTMQECRHKLDLTAEKYNVSYVAVRDERNYFSGEIVKNGVRSDLVVQCKKKEDYYTALFEIPD